MTTNENNTTSFRKYIYVGLIAGIVTAIVNNIYSLIYTSMTTFAIYTIINPISITLASIIPMVVAAIIYFGLNRFSTKALLIFSVGTVFFTLISLSGPLGNQLPDGTPIPAGFAALTIPMHVFAGVFAVICIPRFVKKNESQRSK